MAMNRIGKPQLVQPKVLEQFKKSGGPRESASERSGKKASLTAHSEKVADRVEISANARKLNDMRQAMVAGRRALDQLPDVRQERIAQAKARLQSGFYDSAEVRQEVADKLRSVIKRLDTL